MTDKFETIECWRCGNLNGLRERCNICEGVGVISQIVEEGHETLSDQRARGLKVRKEKLEPKRDDPLWSGTDPR